jgi:Flp pilus assembly protein TadD
MHLNFGVVVAALALSLPAASVGAADAQLMAQGSKQWEEGRLKEARKSFELAVATDPASVEAQMKLGGLLLSSSDPVAAIQSYQRVLSLDANNAKAWIGLGLAYLHTGQKELSRAAFEEAVRVDPGRKTQLAGLLAKPAEAAAPPSAVEAKPSK